MSAPDPGLAAFLLEQGLADPADGGVWTPLAGGVSSDIWRVETGRGVFCVKRALAQLKVAADWRVSTDRNAHEWAYMEAVAGIAPGSVPQPIAHDPARGLFAMAWLAPDAHRLWKDELLAGRVDSDFAGQVGALCGGIHARTMDDRAIARTFATDRDFHALRIAPYLLATAERHADLAPAILIIAGRTAMNRRALVHGDVSPKNILIGPAGPVLLDAECAWFGDPAFDLAFCMNHLVIKARVVEGAGVALRESADRLAQAWLAAVPPADAADMESRAAALLPVLALARVDGKSPVEYLDERQRDALRAAARRAIGAGCESLSDSVGLLIG